MNPTCIYRSDPLAPVTKALAPIANISVESQVLYHTPKSSFSSWNEKLQSYILNDLPFFVRTFFSKIHMTNLDITDSLTDYYCDMEHDLASVSGSVHHSYL
ncbi:unnamed protein product [Brassica rapa subsp. trilocularis]